MKKISRRGTIALGLGSLVIVIGIILVFQARPQPRLWTAVAVFKHLDDYGLRVKNVNTDFAALPPNLAPDPSTTCREHVVFSIVAGDSEIPNNQLFVCDRIQDLGGLSLRFAGVVKNPYTLISNDNALVMLVLNPDLSEGISVLYKVTFATLGMKYVGPPD